MPTWWKTFKLEDSATSNMGGGQGFSVALVNEIRGNYRAAATTVHCVCDGMGEVLQTDVVQSSCIINAPVLCNIPWRPLHPIYRFVATNHLESDYTMNNAPILPLSTTRLLHTDPSFRISSLCAF